MHLTMRQFKQRLKKLNYLHYCIVGIEAVKPLHPNRVGLTDNTDKLTINEKTYLLNAKR